MLLALWPALIAHNLPVRLPSDGWEDEIAKRKRSIAELDKQIADDIAKQNAVELLRKERELNESQAATLNLEVMNLAEKQHAQLVKVRNDEAFLLIMAIANA